MLIDQSFLARKVLGDLDRLMQSSQDFVVRIALGLMRQRNLDEEVPVALRVPAGSTTRKVWF